MNKLTVGVRSRFNDTPQVQCACLANSTFTLRRDYMVCSENLLCARLGVFLSFY
jgi:hypothetical protein